MYNRITGILDTFSEGKVLWTVFSVLETTKDIALCVKHFYGNIVFTTAYFSSDLIKFEFK